MVDGLAQFGLKAVKMRLSLVFFRLLGRVFNSSLNTCLVVISLIFLGESIMKCRLLLFSMICLVAALHGQLYGQIFVSTDYGPDREMGEFSTSGTVINSN